MASRPAWRRVFDAVERPVGARLESAVQTERFADAAGTLVRLRAGVERRLEQVSRRALHRANLPAASDIARVREQLAGLERVVRRLDEQLAAKERGARDGDDGPSRSARTGATGRRPQSAAGPQRREVRGGGGSTEGGRDTEGHRLAP